MNNALLHHLADRFVGLGLAHHGVTLLQFASSPRHYELFARYIKQRVAAFGVSWRQYQQMPEHYDARVTRESEPLLPRQRAVAERLQRAWKVEQAIEDDEAELEDQADGWRDVIGSCRSESAKLEQLAQRNGSYFEPLHHKRGHQRSGAAHFQPRGN